MSTLGIIKLVARCDAAETRVRDLEASLADAKQWIDSEPDWKDQYNANYEALRQENARLKEQERQSAEALMAVSMNLRSALKQDGALREALMDCFSLLPPERVRLVRPRSMEMIEQTSALGTTPYSGTGGAR